MCDIGVEMGPHVWSFCICNVGVLYIHYQSVQVWSRCPNHQQLQLWPKMQHWTILLCPSLTSGIFDHALCGHNSHGDGTLLSYIDIFRHSSVVWHVYCMIINGVQASGWLAVCHCAHFTSVNFVQCKKRPRKFLLISLIVPIFLNILL